MYLFCSIGLCQLMPELCHSDVALHIWSFFSDDITLFSDDKSNDVKICS